MDNEAWKSIFFVARSSGSGWLVMEKGSHYSYNMILYKTEFGAKRGAKAEYNKINKEFEKHFLGKLDGEEN